jgi:flagellar basal-body rod protein FlgC
MTTPLFGTFGIAASGVTVYRKWLDAVSDNIANISTVTSTDQDAFREKFVVAQAVDYGSGDGGVQVAGIEQGSGTGRLVHQPDHPLADADGYVKYPDIDLGSQMAQMMMAQRGYQANLAVVDRAHDAYSAAIQVGRNA